MSTPKEFQGSPSDLRLGPASITYGDRNLGYTLNDSVSISLEQTSTPIQPDQASLPLKDIITGMNLEVSLTLGEVTRQNLKMLPGFDEDGNFKDPIGIDLLAIAKELIVAPISSDDDNIYVFPKATPLLNGPLGFARETPQGLELNFKCFVDSSGTALMLESKSAGT